MLELYIFTGPSGSGKTTGKFVFEELGFYIVENAPYELTKDLLDYFVNKPNLKHRLCLIPNLMDAQKVLSLAKKDKRYKTHFILLDAKKDVVLKRFALSRHDHPRATLKNITLEKAVDLDAEQAELLSSLADLYIDTSNLTSKELRNYLYRRIENEKVNPVTKVTFLSFGFKNGIPSAVDTIIDTRVLPNPYWVENLASLTGKDKPVIDYIKSFPITDEFLKNITQYLEYMLSEIKKSERPSYTIGVACSGGQHRSTFVAEYLGNYFKDKYDVVVIHRDMPYLNK